MMLRIVTGLFICLAASAVAAETRIAILDFELKDLTLAPGIPAEIQRTASLRPFLAGELAAAGYAIVSIPFSAQRTADAGTGYLFDHADAAAELGKQFGADYVLVGRLHKPSFLFAYVMGHLVRVADQRLIGNFIIESKGPSAPLVIKAVESLADKIDGALDNRYDPPPPDSIKGFVH